MADPGYEIDDEGNLVGPGAPKPISEATDSAESLEEVTPAARRLFLAALLAGDALGVLVLAGSALLLPESRTILLVLAAAYAVISVPIFVYFSRSTQRKVEESQQRYSSS